MNFSDETVSKVALEIRAEMPEGNYRHNCNDWKRMAKAALSSLTLADLMQVEKVKGLVKSARDMLEDFGVDDSGKLLAGPCAAYQLEETLIPFTEAK